MRSLRSTRNGIEPLASMEYPPESAIAIKYSSLESKATQDTFSGKPVLFRAVYLGETVQEAYSGFIAEEQMKGKVALNTRGVGFSESSAGPFGTTASELPRFGVLVTSEVAEKLKDIKKGNMVEFEGVGHSVKPGSKFSKDPAFPMVPGYASFIVQVTKADTVRPINHPAERAPRRLVWNPTITMVDRSRAGGHVGKGRSGLSTCPPAGIELMRSRVA